MCNCTKKVAAPPPPVVVRSAIIRPASSRAFIVRQTVLRSGATTQPAAQPPPLPTLPTLDTSVWGPPLWKTMHIAAQCTGVKSRQTLWVKLFKELRTGLPCPDCSAHYNAWLNTHPVRLSLVPNGGVDMGKWLLSLHNDINRRNGKPLWTLMQVSTGYSTNIEDAKEAAHTLQGKIGDRAYLALMALLNS